MSETLSVLTLFTNLPVTLITFACVMLVPEITALHVPSSTSLHCAHNSVYTVPTCCVMIPDQFSVITGIFPALTITVL